MLARNLVRSSNRAVLRPVLGARPYSLLRPDIFGDQQNQMDYSNQDTWHNNLLFQERIVDHRVYNPALDKSKNPELSSIPSHSTTTTVSGKISIPDAIPLPRSAPTTGASAKFETSESSKTSVRYAAIEEQGPLSSVSFVVNGGSRYEGPGQSGFSHLFKTFAFKGSKEFSGLRLTREFELRGINLYVSVSREHITFTAQFLRNNLADVIPVLKEIVTKTDFSDYKVESVVETVTKETEHFSHNAEVLAFDALHRVAFRSGLANPVFASAGAASHVDSKALADYVAARTTQGEITVVGHNVALDELVSLTDPLFESGKPARTSTSSSKYYGGNTQLDAHAHANQAIVAFEAPSLGSTGYAVAQVLQGLLGNTSSAIKWGLSASALSQSVKSVAASAEAAAFHLAYSDAGLFGLHAQGAGSQARDAVKAGLDLLKSVADGKATDKDLVRAKNAAKLAASRDASASRLEFVEEFGRQIASVGKYLAASDAFAAIDKVSASDISSFASKLLKSKPTVVYVGDSSYAVFSDTLGL